MAEETEKVASEETPAKDRVVEKVVVEQTIEPEVKTEEKQPDMFKDFENPEDDDEVTPVKIIETKEEKKEVVEEEVVEKEAEASEAKSEDEEKSETEEPKKVQSVEERIGQLTRRQRETERDNEALKAENARLKEVAKPAEEPAKEPVLATKDKEPDPDNYDGGEIDRKFIADTAKFYARQEHARLERLRASTKVAEDNQAKLDTINNNWENQRIAGATKHEDFEDKVIRGVDEGKWKCTDFMGLSLKASNVGAEMAYHLASNPDESERISRLEPLGQVLELGKLQAKFEAPATPVTKEVPVTKAPTPPKHTAKGGSGKTEVPADTDDFEAFNEAHNPAVRTAK